MAILPVTIGATATDILAQLTDAEKVGPATLWNPESNGEAITVSLEASGPGGSADSADPSTATVTLGADTTDGEVVVPAGSVVLSGSDRWLTDEEKTFAAATASTATVTLASSDTTDAAAAFPTGTLICKDGEHLTGPFWATDAPKTLVRATQSTATERFTIDNDTQAVLIPAETAVKKAADPTLWKTAAPSSTARATKSTAIVTLGFDTSAGEVTVPAASAIKVAAVDGNWTIDAEAVAPAATYSTAVVEVVGTPGTVIAAGKRVKHAGGAVYWALDAEITIPAAGFIDAAVTCTTIGAQAAAAGYLDTIHDAVAGWTGCENEAAATVGVTAAPTISRTCTCAARGATAAAPGALDTIVDAVAGWSSVTNPAAATAGEPLVAYVDLTVTCETRGAIAALAASLDTLPVPVTGVSAVSNPAPATPGLTTTPSTTVGVTCQTLGDVAALATTLNTFVHPEDLEVGVSVSNANAATPGTDASPSTDVGVTCDRTGPTAAAAGAINAIEAPIAGWVSVTNADPATPGNHRVLGAAADFVIHPRHGLPVSLETAYLRGVCASGSKVLQVMTGENAKPIGDSPAPASQPVTGSVTATLARDVAAVLVGEGDTTTADTTPTTVADGHALPTTGAKETIVLQFVVTAAAEGTLTGTVFCWQSLGATPGWYPLRQATVGNLAAIEADADQDLGSVVEIAWPRGVTRIDWECTAQTGTATGHYVVTA